MDLDALFEEFEVEVSIGISASPDRVWDLVSDPTRITEFSPEVIKAEWLDGGPKAPVPGARFAGTNRLGEFEWTRTCTVVDAKPNRLFAWVVGDRFDGSPTARWSFELMENGWETIVRQEFRHLPTGRSGTRLLADQDPDKAREIVDARRDMLEKGMRTTLEAIRTVLEKG